MTGTKLSSDNKVGFRPNCAKQQSVDWSQMTVDKWQQTLMALVEGEIKAEERLYWMLTFRDWIEFVPQNWQDKDAEQCLFLMIQVAYELADWPMLSHCFEMLQQLPTSLVNLPLDKLPSDVQAQVHAQQVSLVLQQAVALWQMGQLQQAKSFLQPYIVDVDESHPLADFYYQVEQDLARMLAYSEALGEQTADSDIYLIPLEEQHLAGFSWVYQDSNVAKLCNLPEFADDEQWFHWLAADQMSAAKQVFAVNHRQWGLVGSVSIEVHDGAGFFYYWLGEDFQGGGIGPVAVSTLLDWATKAMAMKCCYAKVFVDNIPSQKALKKMSFVEVPFKISSPNDDQMYFYRGPEKPQVEWGQELIKLAAVTDVDSVILV